MTTAEGEPISRPVAQPPPGRITRALAQSWAGGSILPCPGIPRETERLPLWVVGRRPFATSTHLNMEGPTPPCCWTPFPKYHSYGRLYQAVELCPLQRTNISNVKAGVKAGRILGSWDRDTNQKGGELGSSLAPVPQVELRAFRPAPDPPRPAPVRMPTLEEAEGGAIRQGSVV